METASGLFYLIAAILFILALRGLSHPETARRGNQLGMAGMVIAVITTLAMLGEPSGLSWTMIVVGALIGGSIGTFIALRIQMTALPQLVAAFHSLVGLAAVFVAAAAFYQPSAYGIGTIGDIKAGSLIEMSIGTAVGAVTFTGSIIAFGKLQGIFRSAPVVFPMQHWLNLGLGILLIILVALFVDAQNGALFWLIALVSFALGVLMIIPIGGADMPVVISMLNSYSGWAAAGIGFTLGNTALIITGALVGSSGAILSYIMCKGMNRSFVSVILGGFGGETAGPAADQGERTHKAGSAEDAAFIMENAGSVIVVPGYGMAVAQAQHALREMGDILKDAGVNVRYAIHPVAGRMPGHMNVLLAEADVPYEQLLDLDQVNPEFEQTDVALVIGANDVVNPAARHDQASPIYGMPILDVDNSRQVFVIKRSMNPGFPGIQNELFFHENTGMVFGDAKKVVSDLTAELADS